MHRWTTEREEQPPHVEAPPISSPSSSLVAIVVAVVELLFVSRWCARNSNWPFRFGPTRRQITQRLMASTHSIGFGARRWWSSRLKGGHFCQVNQPAVVVCERGSSGGGGGSTKRWFQLGARIGCSRLAGRPMRSGRGDSTGNLSSQFFLPISEKP